MSSTVLVVDDSRMSRMMVSAIIRSAHPDWTILEAEDGLKALEICQSNRFDFATIDMNMPGMDGIELCEKLVPEFPDAHFSLLTANVQEATKDKTQALGIGFIPKPVTEDKILAFIDAEVTA